MSDVEDVLKLDAKLKRYEEREPLVQALLDVIFPGGAKLTMSDDQEAWERECEARDEIQLHTLTLRCCKCGAPAVTAFDYDEFCAKHADEDPRGIAECKRIDDEL